MAVRRIVANIAVSDMTVAMVQARRFYGECLGLDLVMDHGWIATLAAPALEAAPQISVAEQGGAGAPVPDLSIEVDDFDDVLARLRANGVTILYGPVREDWGVERIFVQDPFGRLVNILAHRP